MREAKIGSITDLLFTVVATAGSFSISVDEFRRDVTLSHVCQSLPNGKRNWIDVLIFFDLAPGSISMF